MMSKTFKTGGIRFLQTTAKPSERGTSDADQFVLVKTDSMLDFYRGLEQYKPKEIMEVGMYEGGSLVWMDQLYKPTKLVGLDVRTDPIVALEDYRATRPHIRTYYGRYQQHEGTLAAAHTNFPTGMDLVIDDASHLYELTKQTFCMLFPMVRPGGHYVIEDWSWSHHPAYQGKGGVWADRPALTNLVLELVVMSALHGVIESIHIDRNLVCIRKGRGPFRKEMFDLSDVLRGREMQLI